jgi:RNA polymerase sigma-70 factor (ECF subfamily)
MIPTTTNQPDPHLIDRASRDDGQEARRELLEGYRDYLRRMVAARLDRRLAPRVDPSDVVQEALADASRRLDDYFRDRPLPFLAWLRQITAERVIDAHRRHIQSQRRSVSREVPLPEAPPDESAVALARLLVASDTSPSNRLIRRERSEQLTAALDALAPRDREILVMRHLEQLSTAEIAEALGLSAGAVEGRLLRALLRLRSRMGQAP